MGVFSRIRGSNNKKKSDDNKKQTGPTSSRMEERLRTARILAEDDDDDEPNRRRTQAQIERDLSDPRVHKRIVENLYGAYKIRVRYIYLCYCVSFVFRRFLKTIFSFRRERAEKSKNIASLLSLFCSRFIGRFRLARDVLTRGRTSRRMGLNQETVFLYSTTIERERKRETGKEIVGPARICPKTSRFSFFVALVEGVWQDFYAAD